ncbi:tRNA-2-methylthio-N6-dimethylallyladenosine synthase [Caldanaerobius fijiensis DSM 17918]|uniref:tRNA-2-methylthio-N(6)-dimethylallyladenosine synthase n=1 Tax=Caldanaerobius fijiensis DSM 17918 TaxID=1121256 RepID=A0A1M4YER3_9THEO|nr:tRNA (N6-isopentenyl adenosine(37)-C2)-methylthiotransferase MiaB [Caldanaerobius fijiensis]SHF04301.1 tRNA-2-methylthio-N6-dimethylallyladenosine synthase [Caldanaerobius fijiensis DSM 17918]
MKNNMDLKSVKEAVEDIKKLNEEYYKKTGVRKKYLIFTFGCQMNQHDSEVLSGMLEDMGYEETKDINDADVILFNTCAVREHAEVRALSRISQLKELKREKPDVVIGMSGCVVQEKGAIETIMKKLPYIDLVFGTHNIHEFPKILQQAIQSSNTIIDVWEGNGQVVENLPIKRTDKVKAFVNVTYGCDNFCTYCIVPYVRGRERSRKPEDIINEVRELARQGFKEVNLLGQNVNSYGRGLEEKVTFADLLRMINEIEGIERIRFTTSHPKDLTDDLIYAMRDCEKVCEHLHLPFQAGSNRILKAMNRRYTKEKYLDLIYKLRENIPNIALSTDIIVGFPGETDEDFEDTLDLVRTVRFDSAFTFIYSKRTGTPAAEMPNQVPDAVKHERFNRLVELQNKITAEKNAELVGNVYDVLVEEVSKKDPNKMTGRTRTNKLVHFVGDESIIGRLVNVKITASRGFTLEGEII